MTKDEYHRIDYRIMAAAFSIHNKQGRFHDESVYRDERAYKIQQLPLGTFYAFFNTPSWMQSNGPTFTKTICRLKPF